MGERRCHGVRIGTESPVSHLSIASNITIANFTTNPPFILTTVADGRLGYALPSSNGYVHAPQGRVLPAWAYPGRTEQYLINLVSTETTTEESTSSVVIIEEAHTLIKHKFVQQARLSNI
ncbi:hypothetical protein D8674_034020 [Pyrus ussuriensis x Pyrus communis]|uniref:Uncharacterized protein n=1 Tax=Pyrus ussuriensis x Pyrus communis TaxID=2448454 RepID=A0A5N5HN07_9ROSA|nr:hypothetical protein D8674_034020 [Pyrus ussuriensis x Pyrus communis]